jgi:hypothetical protein
MQLNPYQTPEIAEYTRPVERPLNEREIALPLQFLGLALMLPAGAVGLICVSISMRALVVLFTRWLAITSATGGPFVGATALGFVCAVHIIAGYQTWRLRSRRWANFGCVLGVLPLGPAFCLTCPLAIWASARLNSPVGKAMWNIKKESDVAKPLSTPGR